MYRFEERDFELFAHDIETLAYFCQEIERPSGQPVLATMVIEGVEVLSTKSPLLEHARKICLDTLQAGPAPLASEALESRRYAITDLLFALLAAPDEASRIACGSAIRRFLRLHSPRSRSVERQRQSYSEGAAPLRSSPCKPLLRSLLGPLP